MRIELGMKNQISVNDKKKIEIIMWFIEKKSLIKHKDLLECLGTDKKYKMSGRNIEDTIKKFEDKKYFIKIPSGLDLYYCSIADLETDIIDKENVYQHLIIEMKLLSNIFKKIKSMYSSQYFNNEIGSKIDLRFDYPRMRLLKSIPSPIKDDYTCINTILKYQNRSDQQELKNELLTLRNKNKENFEKLCEYVTKIHTVKPSTKKRQQLRIKIFKRLDILKKINKEIYFSSYVMHCPRCRIKLPGIEINKYNFQRIPGQTCKKCKRKYVVEYRNER